MLESNEDKFGIEETLESWVMEKCREWRDHYESNYENKFDEYYRLWRGIFSSEDRTEILSGHRLSPLPYSKP